MLVRNQLNALFLLAVFVAGGVFAPLGHRQGHDAIHNHAHPELPPPVFGSGGDWSAAVGFLVEASTVSVEPGCQLCARLVFRKYFRQELSAPDVPAAKLIPSTPSVPTELGAAHRSIRAPPFLV